MKKIAFLFLFATTATFTFAQNKGNKDKSTTQESAITRIPTISVNEESFDFGKIPQGKPVHHTFVVTNNATGPYKLNNVQASCGCTTPEWEKDKIMQPGESSNINVGYNAAAEGNFTKSITITFCDTLSKVITIKGQVWKTPAASAPANSATQELKDKK